MTKISHAFDDLLTIAPAPEDDEAFKEWLKATDALDFLQANARQDEFVVFASIENTFIHAVIVPAESVNPPDVDDLMTWNCTPWHSWSFSHNFADPPDIGVVPPLDHTSTKTLEQGEQLVYMRHFEEYAKKGYVEILQKFVHMFGLHYLEERNAYCRLDDRGDLHKAIRVIEVPPSKSDSGGGTVVLFDRELLDQYLALSDASVVRMFDFTRIRLSQFGGWSAHPEGNVTEGDISYKQAIQGNGSYTRGFQIVHPMIPPAKILHRIVHDDGKERKYESFLAHDWKNKVVTEISTDPAATANYFTESQLPFEVSPAFFRPDVLSKYKQDREKYRVEERSLSCRGAWHLETYDINEAGQVHTYICYLRRLPYEEQVYWKSFNEPPKGGISERAFLSDFKGSWELPYNALGSLKQAIRELQRQRVPWWTLRNEDLLDHVQYPATTSVTEWADELLQLDQLVIEGFEEKWLRKKAEALGRTPPAEHRSLKLVEESLVALGFEEEHARTITAPLHTVHDLRSKLKGHAKGKDAEELKKAAIREYGTYREHFRHFCRECDESIRTIMKAFEKF